MNAGCSSLSKSKIFENFSLQTIASKAAYKYIDCSKGSGSDDFSGFGAGRGGTGSVRPSTIRCEVIKVGNIEFNESDFFDALLSEVEKEIKVSGGTITRKNRPGLNNFVVDYEVNGRQGKINISGKRSGVSYDLTSEIREGTK
jgi:hypothetical protein